MKWQKGDILKVDRLRYRILKVTPQYSTYDVKFIRPDGEGQLFTRVKEETFINLKCKVTRHGKINNVILGGN